MAQDHTTAELSPGEQLLLMRRRLGLGQRAMAQKLGASRTRYYAWEDDAEPVPANLRIRGMLRSHEWCYIRRKRSGLSRQQVAHLIGRSPQWVTRMERGQVRCNRLLQFWEERDKARLSREA